MGDGAADDDLIYIGHSMGTTALFVMLSEMPEYNEKIKLFIALAPVAFMTQ
jgi:lysosomal acid lipase/cholesteryl ester hydrolase